MNACNRHQSTPIIIDRNWKSVEQGRDRGIPLGKPSASCYRNQGPPHTQQVHHIHILCQRHCRCGGGMDGGCGVPSLGMTHLMIV